MKRFSLCRDADGVFIDFIPGKYPTIEALLLATSKEYNCTAVFEHGVVITDLPDDYELCSRCKQDHEYDGPGDECKEKHDQEFIEALDNSAIGSSEGYTLIMNNIERKREVQGRVKKVISSMESHLKDMKRWNTMLDGDADSKSVELISDNIKDFEDFDQLHPGAIRLLVYSFVFTNKYEDLLGQGALDDTSKNRWIAQVNRAAFQLEESLGDQCCEAAGAMEAFLANNPQDEEV